MQRGSMKPAAAAVASPNFMNLAPLLRELRTREQASPQLDLLARNLEGAQ